MPTLEDALKFESLYCLFKGEPGTRKSTCALSFPSPQYWMDYDLKMEALGLPMKQWNITPKAISYDSYTNWEKARIKLEQLQVNCPYRTIIDDSLTSQADATIRQTVKLKSSEGGGKKIAGIPVSGYDEFNAEAAALSEMIALTKDIHKFHKVNFILIAHIIQKEIKSANGQTHMSRVLVTAGKAIAQKIPAYCGEVYHFNIKGSIDTGGDDKYSLFTRHTGDDFARTSLPLPAEINFGNDPLYEKWIAPAIQKMAHVVPTATTTTPQPTTKNSFEAR